MRRTQVIVIAMVAALVAACGSGDESDEEAGGNGAGGNERHSQVDEDYVRTAIHQYGSLIGLAKLTEGRSDTAAVVGLAEEIVSTLNAPLDDVLELENEWDLPLIVYDQVASASYSLSTRSMAPDPVWEMLRELEGPEFDALWLTTIRDELERTAASARAHAEDGRHEGLQELARATAEKIDRWLNDVSDIEDALD